MSDLIYDVVALKGYTPRDRPMIFQDDMVNAIFDGRKRQTRRHGCLRWYPGDKLWVRECFHETDDLKYHYRATEPDLLVKWQPSIYMPRMACRLRLLVTGVRRVRLRNISEHDARLEGFPTDCKLDPTFWFSQVWDSINTKPGYEFNSHLEVWAIDFKRFDNGDNEQ